MGRLGSSRGGCQGGDFDCMEEALTHVDLWQVARCRAYQKMHKLLLIAIEDLTRRFQNAFKRFQTSMHGGKDIRNVIQWYFCRSDYEIPS